MASLSESSRPAGLIRPSGETAVFGGMPIEERRDRLQCGVAVVDLPSAKTVGLLEFQSGVEEIFDVEVLPASVCPAISGPHATDEGRRAVWRAPQGCPSVLG